MCDCCKKILVGIPGETGLTGPQGPQGPQGDPGPTGTLVDNVFFQSQTSITLDVPKDIQYTTTANGNYIVMLQGQAVVTGSTDLTTELEVNGTTVLNVNDSQRDTYSGSGVFTFTHTALLTGITTGQAIGYKCASSSLDTIIDNASLTIFKIG